jgi:predicted histone-like DNA-binding protein
MAKFIYRELPDFNKDGKQKAYYKMETYRNYSNDEFVKYMVESGIGVSSSMVNAVLTQVSEKLSNLLGMGYTVTIDGIGTFSTKIGLKKGKEMEDRTESKTKRNAASVEVTGINLRVDKEFVKKVNSNCDLQRSGEHLIKKSPYSEAERLKIAKEVLKRYGRMRVVHYMQVVGLSKSSAYRDLCKFVADPKSGITTIGRGPTKEYVLRNVDK